MAKIYDAVLKRANIRDVLNAYDVKIVGNKCICPFHADKNPSMLINDKKQFVKCFACGTGANAITFVYKYEKEINHKDITYNDAVKKVAEICNINDIDLSSLDKRSKEYQYTSNGHKYDEKEKDLLATLDFVQRLAAYTLKTNEADAKTYLQNRGFDEELIQSEGYGYLLPGQLLASMNKRKELSADRLEAAGLIRYGEDGKPYEVFKDRVLIPVRDDKGNTVTFSGRAVHNEEPKYLHGINTSVFRKENILYNYHEAKNYAYGEELYIVEGFMDVAGGKRMGLKNIVATMGVDISHKQLELIRKSKSTINLMRDNDKAGKAAMLKEIPMLIKQGVNVNVIDLSSYPANCKDLWDIANSNEKLVELEKHKVSGFTYLMDHKYFANKEVTTETIFEVYQKAKEDGIIKTTLHENMFFDYIKSTSEFQRDELQDIIHPRPVEAKEDSRTRLRDQIETEYVLRSVDEYLSGRDDSIMRDYYEIHKEQISEQIIASYRQTPQVFLYKDNVNAALLLNEQLRDDKEFEKFDFIHRFPHEQVFQKAFIKNINGEARLQLNQEQQAKIINQYHDMDDQDNMALESVEDLYIVNHVNDLDGILDLGDKKELQMLKDRIKFQMSIYPEKMMYFKYGNIFREEDKYAISDDYKDASGEYKTLLLYNNLDNKLDINKNQVIKHPVKDVVLLKDNAKDAMMMEQLQGREQKVNESEKGAEIESGIFRFSIHKSIIKREDDDKYFVRIPGTKMKCYTYFSKNECKWASSGEMMYTSLKDDRSYMIYDANGDKKEEWTYADMKRKWEDKTKSRKVPDQKKNPKEEQKPTDKIKSYRNKVHHQDAASPEVEKIVKNDKANANELPQSRKQTSRSTAKGDYIISKSKIIRESVNGFYINLSEKDKVLFISKKIAEFNKYGTHLLIDPKRSILKNSGVSLYELKSDGQFQFQKHIKSKDIDNYLVSSTKAKNMKYIHSFDPATFNTFKRSGDGVFLKLPANYQNMKGDISINSYYFTRNNGQIVLNVPDSAAFSFYKDGKYAGRVEASDLSAAYESGQENAKRSYDEYRDISDAQDEQEIMI